MERQKAGFLIALGLLASCSASMPEAPQGAVAWCGTFDYTGTWLKTESTGRALGLSDKGLAEALTVEQVIQLAEAMGCPASP